MSGIMKKPTNNYGIKKNLYVYALQLKGRELEENGNVIRYLRTNFFSCFFFYSWFFGCAFLFSPSLILKQAQQILQGGDEKELRYTVHWMNNFLSFFLSACLRQRNETSNCHDTLLFEMCVLLPTAIMLFDWTFTAFSRFSKYCSICFEQKKWHL